MTGESKQQGKARVLVCRRVRETQAGSSWQSNTAGRCTQLLRRVEGWEVAWPRSLWQWVVDKAVEKSAQTDKNTKEGRKEGWEAVGRRNKRANAESFKGDPEVRLRRNVDIGRPTSRYAGWFLIVVKFKLIENEYCWLFCGYSFEEL